METFVTLILKFNAFGQFAVKRGTQASTTHSQVCHLKHAEGTSKWF